MRFEVTGTEGQFGRDVSRIYEAPSEEAAREIAAREGITVLGVDLLLDMGGFGAPPPPPQNLPPPPPPPVYSWRVEAGDRANGRVIVGEYRAHDAQGAELQARHDGLIVLRVTRADQPAPPPLDPYQAEFAVMTASAEPLLVDGDPPDRIEPAPRVQFPPRPPEPAIGDELRLRDDLPDSPADTGWTSSPSRSAASPRPHASNHAAGVAHAAPAAQAAHQPAYGAHDQARGNAVSSAVTAADAHFEPLDPATLAALAASPAAQEPPAAPLPLYGALRTAAAAGVPASVVAAQQAKAAVEHDHPRLQSAAAATYWFAWAAYAVGGLGVAAALVAGITALAQQGTPPAATSRLVALVGGAVGAPMLFAAVVSHAVSGGCLALREIVLRRRRKRDY